MSGDEDYVGRTLRDAATTGHVIGAIVVLLVLVPLVFFFVKHALTSVDAMFWSVIGVLVLARTVWRTK